MTALPAILADLAALNAKPTLLPPAPVESAPPLSSSAPKTTDQAVVQGTKFLHVTSATLSHGERTGEATNRLHDLERETLAVQSGLK